MNKIKRCFWFLGSLYFAIFMILFTALFVIAGTFIESDASSHLYAAYYVYHNPIFSLLIGGFFCNILISTLRRWPFKLKHMPFIITHIGLLMVLAGVLVKSRYGRQGSMMIVEGSGAGAISANNKWALSLEAKNPSGTTLEKTLVPIGLQHQEISLADSDNALFRDLKIELAGFHPHSKEVIETWIKGDKCVISGLPCIPCQLFGPKVDIVDKCIKARLFPSPSLPWKILAVKAKDPIIAFKTIYTDTYTMQLRDLSTQKVISEKSLNEALQCPFSNSLGNVKLNFNMDFSFLKGLTHPELELHFTSSQNNKIHRIIFPLDGSESLHNLNTTPPYLGSPPLELELTGPPTLLFIEDSEKHVYLFAFDACGRIVSEVFKQELPHRFVVYDRGFHGYSLWADLPFPAFPLSGQQLKERKLQQMRADLQKALDNPSAFCLPLVLLKASCEKQKLDFADICTSYLSLWNNSQALLLPEACSLEPTLKQCLENIDWTQVPDEIKNGCYWTVFILEELETRLSHESGLLTCLNLLKWPLVSELQLNENIEGEINQNLDLLTRLVQQIFYAACYLPAPPSVKASDGKLLSSLFLLHGLHLSMISFNFENPSVPAKIECPLSFKFVPLPPSRKLEENIPLIQLNFKENERQEKVTLRFDSSQAGFKQAVLGGKYLVRFQPLYEEIPYQVRLRQARQINYPDSQQPYSFESDVIITHKNQGTFQEATLSMNHVHETWEGYRFYLANISSSDPGSIKRVQIIVNLDPAKYWLTYPGGFLIVLGSFLLFWFKPYSKKDD